jgi:hypothetical protein
MTAAELELKKTRDISIARNFYWGEGSKGHVGTAEKLYQK